MAARVVEWVLVIHYGPSAHRATYGRLNGRSTKYTKDYIQLSRKPEFLDALARLFPEAAGGAEFVPLRYQWPAGMAAGKLVLESADRPHLAWETSLGAPAAWKMSLAPGEGTAQTIPGDPSHRDFAAAENEFALLASRGAGRPYLLAVKLRGEPGTLHLRAYLKNPDKGYAWADIALAPKEVQALAAKTTRRAALAWSVFDGDEVFFDPARNHDAWGRPAPLSAQIAASAGGLSGMQEARLPASLQGDAAAEALDVDPDEVNAFREQMERRSYGVPDSTATVKTRGSAQRAFADAVKANYGYRCAITGIVTRDFLVASHIVPWSEDQSIRLDPSNGICLSLLVDRAFEKGYLLIKDDLAIHVDWSKVGDDQVLRRHLEPLAGQRLTAPAKEAPRLEYLRRRRAFVVSLG